MLSAYVGGKLFRKKTNKSVNTVDQDQNVSDEDKHSLPLYVYQINAMFKYIL